MLYLPYDLIMSTKGNWMVNQDSLNIQIAKRLRAARINAGYKTANQFLVKHDFPKSSYIQYETGARKISLTLAVKLTSILKTNLIWLLTGKGSIKDTNNDLILSQTNKLSEEEFTGILASAKDKAPPSFSTHEENNHMLLAKILEKTLELYDINLDKPSLIQISNITSGIYLDILESGNNSEERERLIETAISTMQRIIKEKRQAS